MKIIPPSNCPSCNSTLVLVKDQLYCRNLACEAQLFKKIENMCKVLKIKGLGPSTIAKLDLNDLTEVFYLDPTHISSVLGEKITTKLLDEIERSKSADLATALEAMSIPLVGGTASKKIASVVSSIDDITPETCKTAGLGEKVAQNLLNWISIEYQEMKEFLPFSFKSIPVVISNETNGTVCITGKLTSYKTKAEATKLLEAAGYRVVESVSKTLNYLVDEGDSMSAKREKAVQYGITIITDLNDLLKENTND